MPYIIQNSAGQSIVIPDGDLNQDFSIDLIGRNYENYGQILAQSFIDILNNFASNSAPSRQTDGQLWYDTSTKQLRVYNAAEGQWVPQLPIISSGGVPAGENAKGTSYYDQTTGKLYVNDSTGYKELGLPGEINTGFSAESALGSPSRYGTRLRNIFLEDTAGVPRAVSVLVLTNSAGSTPTFTSEEKILALFSGHAEFTAADSASSTEGASRNYHAQLVESGGIGATIRPGINLRSDNDSRIELSNQSYRSDSAYSLNLGSYGADGANITASQVFYNDAHSIPSANATYDIGNASNQIRELNVKDIVVSDTVTVSGNSVEMGTSSDAVNKIYVNDIVVSGDLTFPGDSDIGTNSNPITNAHFENLFANTFVLGNQTFPTSAGNNGDQIYIDGTGQMFWRKPVSNIANIFARGGTSSSNTSVTLDGISETTFIIDIGAGDGITVLDDQIEVNMGAFDTDDLSEGSTNLYFTDARARSAITVTDAGGLGSLLYTPVGTITYNGPSDAEVIGVFSSGTGAEITGAGVVNSVDSEIDHDALQNFDGDEHVPHSDVIITAGDGLTGGGDITASRTLNVGEGYGISVADDAVAVSNTEVRALFSQGDGISIDANGVITNTGVIDAVDTTGFVTKATSQTIGGQKTFTTNILANAGISVATIQGSDNAVAITMSGRDGSCQVLRDGGFVAAGDITAFSDQRLKDNISVIPNALDKLSQIRGVTYNLKDDSTRRHTGVIAQELQQILPEAVHTNDDGVLSVAYGNTVGLLIEAIKELQQEVNDLKGRLLDNGD